MRRQLLISALLMVGGLAGGVWWWSIRLNETEQKLVGAWVEDHPAGESALLLLSNRQAVRLRKNSEKWNPWPPEDMLWQASVDSLDLRYPFQLADIAEIWRRLLRDQKIDRNRHTYVIVRLSDEDLAIQGRPSRTAITESMHKSDDPELLVIFEKLCAGGSL